MQIVKSPNSTTSTIHSTVQQTSSPKSKQASSIHRFSVEGCVSTGTNSTKQRTLRKVSSDLIQEDEEEKTGEMLRLQQNNYHIQVKETSSVATTTNEDQIDCASIDSKQKNGSHTFEERRIIQGASLQNDSQEQYSVGLNIFEELSYKYNRELKKQLKKCILTHKLSMSFDDIAGNDYAKEIINETFVLPSLLPKVFKGNARPWQSILLYGPPGVGKTMLTQAVCYHSKATCFWVSLADITSKFIGESEKLLAMLFELAREHSPSIILIDEMDSLGRKRTGKESETERRIKTEFLKQMDNIKNIKEKVSVFATTNMPWELDVAALRRFERKILVPMPDKNTRKQIMMLHAGTHHTLTEQDFTYLSEQTEGYSGSDLSTLVNDALMRPIKQLQQATHFRKMIKRDLVNELKSQMQYLGEEDDPEEDLNGSVWLPVIIDNKSDKSKKEEILQDPSVKEMDLAEISEKEVFVRKANLADFKKSIENCKPTVHVSFLELYAKFLQKYGHSDQKDYANEMLKLQQPQYLSYYA